MRRGSGRFPSGASTTPFIQQRDRHDMVRMIFSKEFIGNSDAGIGTGKEALTAAP
jgi:hypothetical protein